MLKKIVALEAIEITLEKNNEKIDVIVRSAGEIGYTTLELFIASQAIAGKGLPFNLHFITRAKYNGDKFAYDKLLQKGQHRGPDFKSTSNYEWARIIADVNIFNDNTVELISRFGNIPVNVSFEEDGNQEVSLLNALIKKDKQVIMLDTTGQVTHDGSKADPMLYKQYGNLLTFVSAPSKKEKSYVPHTLLGVNMGNPSVNNTLDLLDALDANKPEVIHTGSCTTHGVTTVMWALEKNIKGMEILAGDLHIDHSRTPSDNPDQLEGNDIQGTTGFSGAAGKVLSTPGLNNFNVSPVSKRSFHSGVSYYSLNLTIKSDEMLDNATILNILHREANNDMTEQIGVLTKNISFDDKKGGVHNKKKFAINSQLTLKGLLTTAIIDPKFINVTKIADGIYNIVIRATYDNVGGFNYAWLKEANSVIEQRTGHTIFPGRVEQYSTLFSYMKYHSERSDRQFPGMTINDRINAMFATL